MGTETKSKALTDMTLVKRSIENTNKALKKFSKEFSCEAKGSIWGNKHGDVVASSIKLLKQTIIKKRNPDKVLKAVYVKIFIHDPATSLDYNHALPMLDKIVLGIKDFVGKDCQVHTSSCHKKDNELKFCFQGSIVEGDY